jgi:hypothetical protein
MFYEIIYETGDRSVANYATEEEMESAISAHHRRAMNGEAALPRERSFPRTDVDMPVGELPAVRIKRVFAYDKHPADLHEFQGVGEDVVKSELKEAVAASTENGVVHVPKLAAKVRDITNPVIENAGRHESQFKAEGKEVNLDFLGSE